MSKPKIKAEIVIKDTYVNNVGHGDQRFLYDRVSLKIESETAGAVVEIINAVTSKELEGR